MKLLEDTTTEVMNTSVPLTREELAAFIALKFDEDKKKNIEFAKEFAVAFAGEFVKKLSAELSFENQVIQVTTALNKMSSNITTKLTDMNKNTIQENRLLRTEIKGLSDRLVDIKESKEVDKVNPRFENSLSVAETNKWRTDLWDACGIIGKRCRKSKLNVLFEAYDIIRKNYPLDDDFKEYKKNHRNSKQINMCANSDYYRPIVEDVINMLHETYFPEKYTMKSIVEKEEVINSTVILKTPQIISDIVSSYAEKHNISKGSANYRLYDLLCKKSGVKISEKKLDYAHELGYKNISSAYYVANNEKLLNMLKDIAGV